MFSPPARSVASISDPDPCLYATRSSSVRSSIAPNHASTDARGQLGRDPAAALDLSSEEPVEVRSRPVTGHEHRRACGFDGADHDDGSLLDAVRSLGPRWQLLLAGAGPYLRLRPAPEGWSAIENAAHTRDVLALHAFGVEPARRHPETRPTYPPLEDGSADAATRWTCRPAAASERRSVRLRSPRSPPRIGHYLRSCRPRSAHRRDPAPSRGDDQLAGVGACPIASGTRRFGRGRRSPVRTRSLTVGHTETGRSCR